MDHCGEHGLLGTVDRLQMGMIRREINANRRVRPRRAPPWTGRRRSRAARSSAAARAWLCSVKGPRPGDPNGAQLAKAYNAGMGMGGPRRRNHASTGDGLLDRSRQRLNSSGQSGLCEGISPAFRLVRDDGAEPDCHRCPRSPANRISQKVKGSHTGEPFRPAQRSGADPDLLARIAIGWVGTGGSVTSAAAVWHACR